MAIYDLEQALGISFKDRTLLEQALVHSSVSNKNPDSTMLSNERLEFLGDAVLNFIVTQKLYHEFPELSEGKLTKIRASLICRDALFNLALLLKLGEHLHLGKGEEISGGREKNTNLADTMEAVIGAIFLDQGMTITTDFILKLMTPEIQKIREHGITSDYKTQLQEHIQAEYHQTPVYHLVEAKGLDHDKSFTVKVTLGNRTLGRGSGKSKQSAEMKAARSAWEQLQKKR